MRNYVSVREEHSTTIQVTCRPCGHRKKMLLGSCHRRNCCFSVPEGESTCNSQLGCSYLVSRQEWPVDQLAAKNLRYCRCHSSDTSSYTTSHFDFDRLSRHLPPSLCQVHLF